MGIAKVSDPDCDGLISAPINYGGKINHIEIPHDRSKKRTEDLTEEEQPILRSGLGG